MPNPTIVHHLHHGRTPCQMRGVPRDWPPGHHWSVNWEEVTCTECKAAGAGLVACPRPPVVELALAIVAPDARAACAVCGKLISARNQAVWAGTPTFGIPALCICGECLVSASELLSNAEGFDERLER